MSNILSEEATTIVLQEKWIEIVKKHPLAYFFLILFFCVLPLVLAIFIFSTSSDKNVVGVIMVAFGLLIFLLLNIRVIRCMVAPKRFEVSVEDDRLLVKKNEEEVLNIRGKDVTFFKLFYYMKEFKAFRVDYTDDNGHVKRFVLPLDFVPKKDCEDLLQPLALFYKNSVDSPK